jgi:pimeloyl-ACP methyl ester carboxylesterase
MQVELTSTTTSDGIKLHGIILEPETPRTDLTIDCMVMVHGSGANFYASPSNPRAEKFRDMGIPVALFNMRGHDVIAGHSGGHQVGNAWEMLSETHLDQLAILDLLEERGYHKIGLMGSSLGAVRVVIGQAKNQDPRVVAVISLAPLRFSHEFYKDCEMKEMYLGYREEAMRLVAEGKGETIMACDFPNPGAHFSANVYLDRHCSEHYNICVDHANKLNVPLFIGTGSTEVHPRMLNAGRDMAGSTKNNPAGVTWLHVEDGDHGLQNKDDEFFAALMEFLAARPPAAV